MRCHLHALQSTPGSPVAAVGSVPWLLLVITPRPDLASNTAPSQPLLQSDGSVNRASRGLRELGARTEGLRPAAMFAFSFLGSVLGGCACTACGFVSREAMQQSARVAFCILFTLAMVEAWVLRDFAQPLLEKLPCKPPQPQQVLARQHFCDSQHEHRALAGILRHEAEERSEAFYGQQAVYRVSIGNFVSPQMPYWR